MPGKKKKEDQFELTTHLTRHEEDHHEEEDHLHDEIHHEQMHVEANNIEGAEEQDNDNEEQELHPCSFPIKRRIRRKKLNSKGNSWKGKRFSENHSESNASQNSSTGNLKGLVDSSSSSSDSETEGASCHQEVEGEEDSPRNTDAYGQMEFVGSARRTRARYIRISHETSSEKLSQLLKAMNLTQTPKILVSVVGEMKELDLNQGTIENLKDQLGKVCDKIGAMQKESWFLTSAIDQGATKLIAEAVEGYRFKDTNVIGVVSWKSVSYKSRLKQKSDKIRIPTYPVNESQTQSMISNEEIQEDEESDEEMDFLKMESEISDMINNDDLCNIPQPTSVVDEDEIKPVSIPEQLGSIPEDEDETDVDSFKAREHSSSEPIASSSSAPEQRTEGAGQHTDLNKFRSASDRQTKYDREISSDHQGELQDVFEDGPLSQKAFAQAHWQSESILRPNGKRNKYYLNKDHTHFLLVDTGDCEKKDNRADIEFRCKLERLIVDKQIQKINRKRRELHDRRFRTLGGNFEETNFVPAVQLVINGGYKTMTQIRMTLFPNNGGAPTMPLVVVADSGRASKWIATFCELADQERKQRYILRERRNDLKREIMKCYPIKANEIVGILEEVATERRNFVTIYRQGNNLDDKILQALINTNRNQKTKSQKTIEHHKIVLLWNSPEIAEKDFRKMLNHANSAKAHERKELTRTAHQHMTEIFTRALKKQNVQFFRMLLKLDMDITRFTHRMLIDLYDKPCSTGSSNVISSFKKGSSNIFTRCCHKLSNEPLALDTLFYRTYKNTKARTEIEREMLQFVQRTINSRILSLELVDYVKNDRNACLLDPFKDLFLWAVTCNKMEIAKALWEHGENPIAKALIARKIFLKTAEAYTDHSQYDAHIHAKLEENARYFSDKAIQLLEQCSKEKTEDTKQLINKPIPGWGKKTLIELAALSDFQEFICLPRCKDINDQKWRAGIVPMDGEFINLKLSFTVILLFFPWLFFIRYKKDQIHSCNRCKEVHDGSAGPPAQPIQRRSTPLKCIFTKAGDKIKAFFSAPISKFWCNFISYIYFLMFFNFMALNQLDEGPGKLAYVLLCYIIAFTLEEIRQIKDEIGLKFKHKLRRYFKSTWNKLETVSIIIFIGAFTLHLQPIEREEYRSYARFMYSAVLFLCVMKLLQLLSLFRKIGVYVVMLQKMLIDVAYFVLILAVLVIGYAVARFSVLYPKERFGFSSKSTPNLMRKVFLVPIFQLFGESFIDKPEEAEGANNITVFGTPEYNNIEGYGEVVVLWFTFIYMVLTSLLLVNMLIAVFNFTYSVVEKNADEVWHWQNYNLVREYEGKSRFPAPFSILSHLRDLVVYLWQKIKERKPKPDTSSGNDKTDSKGCSTKHRSLNEYFNEQAELNELIQFERDCLGHHLNELIKQEKAQEEAQRKILKQLTTETNKKQYWRWPAINLSRRKNSITGLDVARPNSQPTSPLTRAFTSPPDLVKPK